MSKFPYDKTTETMMTRVFNNLSEKDRRHYASIEAAKLGHGGIKYISGLFGLSTKTISNGIKELKKMTFAPRAESVGKGAGANRRSKKTTR